MSNDETPGPDRSERPGSTEPRKSQQTPGPSRPEAEEPHKADGVRPAEDADAPDASQRSGADEPESRSPAPTPAAGPELPPERQAAPETGPVGEEPSPAKSAGVPDDSATGRQRLLGVLWPPRVTRAQLIVALLLFVLGLGLAIQVRSTSDNSALRGARQEDLVRILDELDDRSQRLEGEKRRLEDQRAELENSSDQAEEARKQTVEKEQQLGVLAGTVAAQGPGINVKITDPRGTVEADMLLDAIQELRAAGAEAIQINNVRIVADSSFSDTTRGVRVGNRTVRAPFTFKVIGKPQDLQPALNIPGGVVQSLEKEQAEVAITASKRVVVDALRTVKRPDYARSSSR